jgi:hypothetical protein
MDSQSIPLALPLEVSFWASSEENLPKVKICEVHPEFPWVIAADKNNNVSIWDYER